MKTLIIFLLTTQIALAQFITRDYTQFSVWTDPVAWHKEGGPQIGAELTKVMRWGWVSVSISHFEALTPSYTDVVGSGGINFNLFNYEPIRFYGGFRLGVSGRDLNFPYPLAGMVAGFDWQIFKNFHGGLRVWVDHREDQKDQFYGDSDAYEPGLIFTSPLSQENGAIVISWSW